MGITDSAPGVWLPIDAATGARETCDIVHAKMHDGRHFTNSYLQALSVGSAINVTVTSPASAVGFIHFSATIEAPFLGSFTFSESAGASAGSDLTSITYNSYRNSATASPASVAGTIVYESSGTVLETRYTSTTRSAVQLGGGVAQRFEYILKPSTIYLLRWLNTGAVTATTVINSAFYY